jgi:hypothetical protein
MTLTERFAGFWSLALAGLMLAILPAWPAAAQGTFVCPGGPGPGEIQVGMTPGGNGVASVPVCASNGRSQPGQSAPPPVQMRALDNYFAAAWHPQSSDAWIVAGFSDENRAKAAALSACNRVMGTGCTVANSNVNGALVIARGTTGELYASSRATRGSAEKEVKQYCRSQNDECEVINWVTAAPGSAQVGSSVSEKIDVFQPRGNPRRSHGAIAWVDSSKLGAKPWIGDVWAVAGRPSADKAKADVLEICQRDTGTPCVAALVASDVFVAVTERDGIAVTAASGATVDLANKRAMDECKRQAGKCRVASTFSLSQDLTTRFDPFAQGKDYFSAQAWTKGSAQPWTTMVWSVGGAKSEDEAKRAALEACAKDSKQECEIGSNSFNSRITVTLDSKGNTRLSYFERDMDPAEGVAKKCADAKVTCRIVKIVDGRIPLTERIELK